MPTCTVTLVGRRLGIGILAAVVVALGVGASAQAAAISVTNGNDSGSGSLRAAVAGLLTTICPLVKNRSTAGASNRRRRTGSAGSARGS